MKLLTNAEKDRRAAQRVVRAQKRFELGLSLKRTGGPSGSARDRRNARRADLRTP